LIASCTDVIDGSDSQLMMLVPVLAIVVLSSVKKAMLLQGNHLMQVMLPTPNELSIVICIHCIKADENVKL